MSVARSAALTLPGLALGIALAMTAASGTSFAVDEATKSAVRQACRSDAMRLCALVQRGGGRILQCLRDHRADVTPACREALDKVPADATAPPTPAANGSR
ncbi:MAG: hypothetical protein HXY22_04870 [Alphaproteobacteria bacterium]|nr:hypothetical protein [Alphaproteobacteria bacterium]